MATNIISRENAEAIIREQIVDAIAQDTPKSSTFMAMAKKLVFFVRHNIKLGRM